jgi:hypothetical protein
MSPCRRRCRRSGVDRRSRNHSGFRVNVHADADEGGRGGWRCQGLVASYRLDGQRVVQFGFEVAVHDSVGVWPVCRSCQVLSLFDSLEDFCLMISIAKGNLNPLSGSSFVKFTGSTSSSIRFFSTMATDVLSDKRKDFSWISEQAAARLGLLRLPLPTP